MFKPREACEFIQSNNALPDAITSVETPVDASESEGGSDNSFRDHVLLHGVIKLPLLFLLFLSEGTLVAKNQILCI